MLFLIDQLSEHQLDISLVGGKSKQLHELLITNYSIPKWTTVSTAFAKSLLKEVEPIVVEWINNNETEIDAKLYALLQKHLKTNSIAEEIETFINASSYTYFSVRSSIPEEDGEQHSFAGMMASYLYAHSTEQILHYILKSICSAFSNHTLLFRGKAGITTLPYGAVIIQEMVTGNVSGVMFTANPKSGKYNEVIINATYGLCEGVVSGSCSTDEYIFNKESGHITKNIHQKTETFYFDPITKKQTLKAIPLNNQNESCLSTTEINQLSAIGIAISKIKSSPQDIEWTIHNNEVYLLQSRPITRMGNDSTEANIVWDNSNIQESYCGVTTPLTYSFIKHAYASVYRQSLKSTKLSSHIIDKYEKTFQNLLGIVNGRVYYNINNWYKMLTLFPRFSQNKADMEKMMGLQEPVDFIESVEKTLTEKILLLFRMIRLMADLTFRFYRIDSLVKKFNAHFINTCSTYNSDNIANMSYANLKHTILELDQKLLNNWVVPIVNDLYVMIYNGKVHRQLVKTGIQNTEEVKSILIFSQNSDIESVLPTTITLKIAKQIRQNELLYSIFNTKPNQYIWQYLTKENPAEFEELNEFISTYGDRCMGELKLETITYKQNPELYIDLLKSYLSNDELLNKPLNNSSLLIPDDYQNLLTGKLLKNLNHLRKAIKHRENLRFQRTRMFGLYRNVFLEMGIRLKLAHIISSERDVFFMTRLELLSLTEQTNYDGDWKSIIKQRKKQQQYFETQKIPHHFKTTGLGEVEVKETISTNSTSWKGIGCFPGIIKAEVKIVKNHDDAVDLKGKILLAERTDPGWTPLFPTCVGVIVERGSALSHSAIITRELGIPAVVNIPNITQLVNNGDILELNGLTGMVTLIKRK